ncbi:hypothetical protein [Effusibacillus lacus]|uniref:Uncharacterized protein n=1 Tax=Effusibacillus lacus TaxID=1348429 RepID=A0A292YPB7_9BACL|nr:hypothetical protein [Effusibacillus lacus]GAX91788.1 hypothetical protein EFBL_3479 [Effusibacillus lacus]
MRVPKVIKGLWTMMAGKQEDLEVSEELTHAYFGNAEAWQIENGNQKNESDATNKKEI